MIEKPPKYQEKVEMEATYFDIQIKLQQLRQAPYLPPEGRYLPYLPFTDPLLIRVRKLAILIVNLLPLREHNSQF